MSFLYNIGYSQQRNTCGDHGSDFWSEPKEWIYQSKIKEWIYQSKIGIKIAIKNFKYI